MQYKALKSYTGKIANCPYFSASNSCSCIPRFLPVINSICSSQRYMIISSDPSGDTDKNKSADEPHSDFTVRFMSLIFFGDDDDVNSSKIRQDFSRYNNKFSEMFYWTHFNKCFANGSPNSTCAKRYLRREIELMQPELIISLGLNPAKFLIGNKNLKEYVNKIWYYQEIPFIVSLHPSRNWNRSRRTEYKFYETWNLIRNKFLS